MKIKERNTCRVSGGPLIEVFNLGNLPISCFPLPGDRDIGCSPLVLCLNEESGLVQLKHTIDPDALYREYWYMSGVNQSMRDSLGDIVNKTIPRVVLNSDDIVVDIASNDSTLLSFYSKDVTRVAIDPSNIKPNPDNYDHYINDYFSADRYFDVIGNKKAKIVTSICVMYDLEDPVSFANDVKKILSDDGIWVIEMSYLPTMLQRNSFETIVAEHIEYYSLKSIEFILDIAGMKVEDVELNDVNGGSFRLYVRHLGKQNTAQPVLQLRQAEAEQNLNDPEVYINFANRINQNKHDLLEFLNEQKNAGCLTIGYGASTKGNTIMSYYGIDSKLLPYVADRNPIKFGRQTVTRIPIISEQEARNLSPNYFLAFAYHFMDEFIKRENDFINQGGKFVVPAPRLRVI